MDDLDDLILFSATMMADDPWLSEDERCALDEVMAYELERRGN